MPSKKTVLITGCSEGSLGEALAFAFHTRGLRVFASARNPSKMANLSSKGIETLPLDVLSPSSIAECVSAVSSKTSGRLDILVNNSGGGYSMPLSDASIDKTRELFELNVFSVLQMTQAFLPLLRESEFGGLLVNQTSISSVTTVPMTGIYNASKAAAASLTDNLRLELAPFKIKVIDLKTGAVRSGFYDNMNMGTTPRLPDNSIYGVAREEVERSMSGKGLEKDMIGREVWAGQVVGDLLKENPELRIWRGENAWAVWFARRFMPHTFLDENMVKMGALDVVRKRVGEGKGGKGRGK